MISWFIIILIVAGIFVLFKISHLKHHKHKFSLMIIVVLILFFIGTFYFVALTNHVDTTSLNGFGIGIKLYGGWLVSVFNNVKVLTGNIIGMDWKTTNGTIGNNNSSNINLIDSGKKAGENVVNATANVVNKVVKPNTPKPITTYK